MPDLSRDPVDHACTTPQHVGESMKNGVSAPGLIAVDVGVVALVADLYAFASGHDVAATVAVAVLLGGVGMGWLALRTRRCARPKDVGTHNISMRFASRRHAERLGAVHTVGHVGVGS